MDPLADRCRDGTSLRKPSPSVRSSPPDGQGSVANHVAIKEVPASISSALLTAPETPLIVSHILKEIKDRNFISECSSWTEYQLDVRDWDTLELHLNECDESEKLRYGYFSLTQTFVLEIPSRTHELCSRQLSRCIFKKLGHLCSTLEEREFEEQIVDSGSADAETSNGKDKHQPDTFLHHTLSPQYGLALEVAYAQKRDRLPELAEFYILECERETQIMIGIDYDYGRTKRATLLTWRRNGNKLKSSVQVLRDNDGTLIPGETLRLSMVDLAPRELIPPSMHDKMIEISVQDLFPIFQLADEVQARVNEARGA